MQAVNLAAGGTVLTGLCIAWITPTDRVVVDTSDIVDLVLSNRHLKRIITRHTRIAVYMQNNRSNYELFYNVLHYDKHLLRQLLLPERSQQYSHRHRRHDFQIRTSICCQ